MANVRSTNIEARNEQRPKRIPISGDSRNVLTISDQDPNYVYRWVNDMKGGMRIRKFLAAGYDFVKDPNLEVGDGLEVGSISGMGDAIQREVGEGTISYLMRILKEYYDEDQNAKLIKATEIEAGIGKTAGFYGKVDIS